MNLVQSLIQENFLACYSYFQRCSGLYKDFKYLNCLWTNSPLTDFNVLLLNCTAQAKAVDVQAELEQGFEFFNKRNLPFSLWYPPYLNQLVNKLDLKFLTNSTTHMGQYCRLDQEIPYKDTGLTINSLANTNDIIDFADLIAKGWDMPTQAYRDFFLSQPELLHPECSKHIYLGRVKNQVALCVEVFTHKITNSIGIYYVTTDSAFRKQGHAFAMQAHLLKLYKDMGYEHAIVLSSPAEQSVMSKLGFKNYGYWTECYSA